MLTLLGLTDLDRINELLDLAQRARQPHWAARYRRVLSAAQMEMLGWEDDAARVIQYHPYLLPDLVRTEDYTLTRPWPPTRGTAATREPSMKGLPR
ncbi:hypothetical protein [Salinispora arenicola]|uniref:hypothetical protein n=1 Tax=Salinispora arenicola TaxID=168697 RepID=UPI000369D436|nr:hypothetical protein [Salinispora arenicola]